MAATGRQGLLQLSCRADQQSGAGCVPSPDHQTLATLAQAAQSEGWHDLGTDNAVGQRLDTQTVYPPSMASNTLRRYAPKVGAVCGKAACTVLCGGRSAMSVPTAIAEPVISARALALVGGRIRATRWLAMTHSNTSFHGLLYRSGPEERRASEATRRMAAGDGRASHHPSRRAHRWRK